MTNSDAAHMSISRDGERLPAAGSSDNFSGEVTIKPLFGPTDERHTGAGQVTFSPRARSAWHTHPAGQRLIVTAGAGWVQEWGQPKQQIKPGDVVLTPPGIKHWHGATDGTGMTHIAIQGFVDGRNVDWMEKVTNDEYSS